MPVDDANAHSASIAVDVPADVAYAFLADGMNQSYWALGSLERRDLGDNLYVGTSMFDGKELCVRLRANAELRLVDYFLGTDREHLVHLVESRVIPGEELGRDPGTCVVTNTHWRPEAATAEEWEMTYYLWKTEVYLIKGCIERGGAGAYESSTGDHTISFDLTGTVAVVTGAAQGIGQAVAVALAQMGADVACVDRDAERQAETVAGVEAHGRRALAIGGDVTDREGVQAAAARVVAELGPIGALVCAAGVITENVPAEQVREEDLDLLWAVNVKGSFHWAVAASRSMVEAGTGRIVLLASQAALVSLPSQAGYTASKGAVAALTRSLAIDWAQHGITVNAICPTFVWTPMAAPMLEIEEVHRAAVRRIPLGRVGQPRDIAGVAAFLCSPAAALVTGVVLPVDGGWTAGEPELPL